MHVFFCSPWELLCILVAKALGFSGMLPHLAEAFAYHWWRHLPTSDVASLTRAYGCGPCPRYSNQLIYQGPAFPEVMGPKCTPMASEQSGWRRLCSPGIRFRASLGLVIHGSLEEGFTDGPPPEGSQNVRLLINLYPDQPSLHLKP